MQRVRLATKIALLEIHVYNTSTDDWSRVWNFLLLEPTRLSFSVDAEVTSPPLTVGEVFDLRHAHATTASYALGKQRLNCHFFNEQEIEFDLDPRDVTGPIELLQMIGFFEKLFHLTKKQVFLTHENASDAIVARFDPVSGSFLWVPVPAERQDR